MNLHSPMHPGNPASLIVAADGHTSPWSFVSESNVESVLADDKALPESAESVAAAEESIVEGRGCI